MLKDKVGWKLAAQIVEAGDGSSPGLVNQAMMELGATYCAPNGSGIDNRDPLKEYYQSTKLGRAFLGCLKEGSIENGLEDLMALSPSNGKQCCGLCDANGIDMILEQFLESISLNSTTEEAAQCGHSCFPTDPPKTAKREEDLAMAVISMKQKTNAADGPVRYLMVKRPKEGLLAGQWEFPNVCVQVRNNKNKLEKSPTKMQRKRSLTKFLFEDLFFDPPDENIANAVSELPRVANDEPTEHIFSHVKHIMWIEVGHLCHGFDSFTTTWTSCSGKQVRWMSEDDMKEVGVTSGVKKVLNVAQSKHNPKTLSGHASKKRKR
mmetsp:Transcript_10452/g.16690  ORF Transcript_10452/g.16690 Transcript_10452/m.16690 type:complete len:320 (+) Transcript_10452:1-960(+)